MENHHSNQQREFVPRQRNYQNGNVSDRPRMVDPVLAQVTFNAERKEVIVSRRTNQGGEYLHITERRGDFANSIKIPIAGYGDLMAAIQDVCEATIKE